MTLGLGRVGVLLWFTFFWCRYIFDASACFPAVGLVVLWLLFVIQFVCLRFIVLALCVDGFVLLVSDILIFLNLYWFYVLGK